MPPPTGRARFVAAKLADFGRARADRLFRASSVDLLDLKQIEAKEGAERAGADPGAGCLDLETIDLWQGGGRLPMCRSS